MKPKGIQTTPTLSNSEYKSLVSEISRIYQNSLLESGSDWNKSILLGNWSIGKRITELFESPDSLSTYGKEIISNLSWDLSSRFGKGFSERNLRSFHKFHKLYKKGKINPLLSWSHYSILITITDPNKRNSLEKKAIRKRLSFRELRSIIIQALPESTTNPSIEEPLPLEIPILKTHSYRTHSPIPNQPPLLDLGFSVFLPLPKKGTLPKGFTLTDKPSYTYRAFLKKVIDGDTLEVLIELGFSTFTTQRLRLNSIDTPELSTKEGMKAKDFVEKTLKDCSHLIIKTYSHDKYDRYLVDVFFLEGKVTEEDVMESGRFLNQEILDAGMGWRW